MNFSARALPQPPDRFVPALGVTNACYAEKPLSIVETRHKGKRAEGLRFQRKIEQHISALYPRNLQIGPWIVFNTPQQHSRYCQPDIVITDGITNKVIVIETKLRHTPTAWWQLEQLYVPVLQTIYRKSKIVKIEVCRWFDPHTSFPVRFEIIDDLKPETLDGLQSDSFYVCIENGRSVK